MPELFVIPAPLRVRILSLGVGLMNGLTVIVKALAPVSKMIPSTVVFAETKMAVVFESANVAVSAGPLGTPIGVQLAAVFQSPEMGSRSHWALIAYATVGRRNIKEQRIAATTSVFIEVISGFVIRCERLLSGRPRLTV